LHTRNVKIYEKDHIHEIYTNSHPKEDLPHLVMLHGFGGTALTYIRTFEHLKEHYQVHALDTFGVGLSSLGNFSEKFTHEETKHYFVDAVEVMEKSCRNKEIHTCRA
jgi:pimeloyl-ACP methyl ester carboxylesterase